MRKALGARALIFADVGVKHAAPLAPRGLDVEAIDAQYRGMADVLVVSGARTGAETKAEDIDVVRKHTTLPLVIGSGTTAENLHKIYDKTDGVIVGSCLKAGGKGENEVDEAAVRAYMDAVKVLLSNGFNYASQAYDWLTGNDEPAHNSEVADLPMCTIEMAALDVPNFRP